MWLQYERIRSPRQLMYRRAVEYVDWGTTFKKRAGKTVGRNTAILELKMLSLIMGEAVRLGHAEANPLASLKIRRDKAAKKPGLTEREIVEIQLDEPERMRTSFEISLNTGCRLRGTRIPMTCINSKESRLHFRARKEEKTGP